jgi:hypothetical protein
MHVGVAVAALLMVGSRCSVAAVAPLVAAWLTAPLAVVAPQQQWSSSVHVGEAAVALLPA